MKFSICIAAHREDQRLFNTLNSIRDIDYNMKDIEVCLFFNGNYENKLSLNKLLSCEFKLNIVDQPLGPSLAKNNAIDMASHDNVILLDSDDFLVPSSLKQFADVLTKEKDLTIGYEFSSINMIAGGYFFPPNREQYLSFFNDQLERALESCAFGRPILIRKNKFIGFDPEYEYAEERKLALDYFNRGEFITMMTTLSYVYNINETGITKDQQSLKRIKDLMTGTCISYKVIDTDSFLNDQDVLFINRVNSVEMLNR